MHLSLSPSPLPWLPEGQPLKTLLTDGIPAPLQMTTVPPPTPLSSRPETSRVFRLLDEAPKPKLAWTELLRMAFELGFIYCKLPWTEAGGPPSFLVLSLALPLCVEFQVASRPWASVSPSVISVIWPGWSFSPNYFECSPISCLCCWLKLRLGLPHALPPFPFSPRYPWRS